MLSAREIGPAPGELGQRNVWRTAVRGITLAGSVIGSSKLIALEIGALLQLAEHLGRPSPAGTQLDRRRAAALQGADVSGREEVVDAVIVVHRQADLLQVIQALRAPGRLARRLHGRQEQGDQHADDGDHDQQFDQRETGGEPAGPCEAHGDILRDVGEAWVEDGRSRAEGGPSPLQYRRICRRACRRREVSGGGSGSRPSAGSLALVNSRDAPSVIHAEGRADGLPKIVSIVTGAFRGASPESSPTPPSIRSNVAMGLGARAQREVVGRLRQARGRAGERGEQGQPRPSTENREHRHRSPSSMIGLTSYICQGKRAIICGGA